MPCIDAIKRVKFAIGEVYSMLAETRFGPIHFPGRFSSCALRHSHGLTGFGNAHNPRRRFLACCSASTSCLSRPIGRNCQAKPFVIISSFRLRITVLSVLLRVFASSRDKKRSGAHVNIASCRRRLRVLRARRPLSRPREFDPFSCVCLAVLSIRRLIRPRVLALTMQAPLRQFPVHLRRPH